MADRPTERGRGRGGSSAPARARGAPRRGGGRGLPAAHLPGGGGRGSPQRASPSSVASPPPPVSWPHSRMPVAAAAPSVVEPCIIPATHSLQELARALDALWAASAAPPVAPPLSPDVLRCVLAHLPFNAIIRHVSRVSKSWRSAALRSVTSYTATAHPGAPWDFNRALSLLPLLTHLKLTLHGGSPAPVALPAALVSLQVSERQGGLLSLAHPLPSRLTHLSVRLCAQSAVSTLLSASAATLVSLHLPATSCFVPAPEIITTLERTHYPRLADLLIGVDVLKPGANGATSPAVDGLYVMLRRHLSQLRSLTLYSRYNVRLPPALSALLASADLASLRHLSVLGVTYFDEELCRHLHRYVDLSLGISGAGRPLSAVTAALLLPKVTYVDGQWMSYFSHTDVDPAAYIHLPRLTRIQRLGISAGPLLLSEVCGTFLRSGRAELVTGVSIDLAVQDITHALLQRCPNLTCVRFANLDDAFGVSGRGPLPLPADLALVHVTRLRFCRDILHKNFIAMLRAMLNVCPNLTRVIAHDVRSLNVAELAAVLAAHRKVDFVRIGTHDIAGVTAAAARLRPALTARLSIVLASRR